MAIDVVLKLDDVGLFKQPRGRESQSQYQRACEIRDCFAHCMRNALNGNGCVMPELCACGDPTLSCVHLTVDYANFTGAGIPLTKRSALLIDQRLRAIGTLVYRGGAVSSAHPLGTYPGDVHIAALSRISSFQGTGRAAGSAKRKRVSASRPSAKKTKRSGLLAWMFG